MTTLNHDLIQTLRMGVVGAGFAAHRQAQALAQVRGLDIQGIVSRSQAGAQALSGYVRQNHLGRGKVYAGIADMAPHVDVLGIFAPNFARIDIMEEIASAVANGADLKGVVCEKPLGRNVPESRRMVQLARLAQLKTAYFENQIFMKPVRRQMQLLESSQRDFGPPLFVRVMQEHAGPHSSWFWDPVQQGGGVLSDMGCHSIALGRHVLTPAGKPPDFLRPVSVWAECALLKWGQPRWRETLLHNHGVDYEKTPAEDFATGVLTFENPDTGQHVKAQFTNSWMFDKQGVRVYVEVMGPGYAFEVNTLNSPLQVFIGDDAVLRETGLEKATSSRGLMSLPFNEPDLYGATDQNRDARQSFSNGTDGFLCWEYGLEVSKLVMAAYLAAEQKRALDLTDPAVDTELETYIPLIQQGRGAEILRP